MFDPPSERIEGSTLVLERSRVGHAAGVLEGIVASLPELQEFMDWAADEPTSLAAKQDWLGDREAAWDEGREFNFVMVDRETDEVIGVCGLMARIGPGALEIGYWVRSDHTGRGVATEAARLLTEAASTVPGVGHVEIRHDLANVASGRVPEKLGYTEIARNDVEIDNPGEIGVQVVWRLNRAPP